MALWWVVALLGTVSEVAASRVGACTGVARQDAAGEQILLALPIHWSGSAPTPCPWWGRGALCRDAVAAAQSAVGRLAAEPCSPCVPWGSRRGALAAVRGQRSLSRHDGAVSCLRGSAEVRNALVRPSLASPTVPSELAQRQSAGEEMGEGGEGSAFIPPGWWGPGTRSLPACAGSHQLSPELLAKHRGTGTHTGLTLWQAGMPEQSGWSAATRCQYGASGNELSELWQQGQTLAEVSGPSWHWQHSGAPGGERIGHRHGGEVLVQRPGEQPQVGSVTLLRAPGVSLQLSRSPALPPQRANAATGLHIQPWWPAITSVQSKHSWGRPGHTVWCKGTF